MRSPSPELIERVMVRDPRAAELLASKPKCGDRWCKHPAKYVILNPHYGYIASDPRELVVCGTHKNTAMDTWGYVDRNRRQEEKRKESEKQARHAANLATMLTDAKHNIIGIRFSSDSGNITLSRDEAQRLLEAWS